MNSIRASQTGLTLADLLTVHPDIARRTAQRLIAKLIAGTQEYLAMKQDLAEPDPLRLAWCDFIKQTIREVITQPELEPLSFIQPAVAEGVAEGEQAGVQALIVEELRRLHEGVLARHGLRPSEYTAWKAVHGH